MRCSQPAHGRRGDIHIRCGAGAADDKGEIDKSIPHLDKVIALYQSIKNEPEVNNARVNKATYLARINEYEKATSLLFAALKYYEKNPKGHNFQNGLGQFNFGYDLRQTGKA